MHESFFKIFVLVGGELSPRRFSSFYRGASCLKSPRFRIFNRRQFPVDIFKLKQIEELCQALSIADIEVDAVRRGQHDTG